MFVAPLLLSITLAVVPAAERQTARVTKPAVLYRNCDAVHVDYPHGVGRPGAHDTVSGRTKPVTTFKPDGALYASLPKTLDRDKDGVACEKL